MKKLEGKIAVITGAGSGIGRAIAIMFAQHGASVIAADINGQTAEETVAMITAENGSAIAITTDVSKQRDVDNLIDTAVGKFGTVDILVNNAGIMDNMEPVADVKDEQWEKVMNINAVSVMRMTRKVMPIMLAKKSGAIVNIASIGGVAGKFAGCAYTASKHAVIGITKSTGYMYAASGVRCNAIAPGAVDTNIGSTMTSINEFGYGRTRLAMTANPRVANPEEIAHVALFLASEGASFMNGAVLIVDGGWTA